MKASGLMGGTPIKGMSASQAALRIANGEGFTTKPVSPSRIKTGDIIIFSLDGGRSNSMYVMQSNPLLSPRGERYTIRLHPMVLGSAGTRFAVSKDYAVYEITRNAKLNKLIGVG